MFEKLVGLKIDIANARQARGTRRVRPKEHLAPPTSPYLTLHEAMHRLTMHEHMDAEVLVVVDVPDLKRTGFSDRAVMLPRYHAHAIGAWFPPPTFVSQWPRATT